MGIVNGKLASIDPPERYDGLYTINIVDDNGKRDMYQIENGSGRLAGLYGQLIERKIDALRREKSDSKEHLQQVEEELKAVKVALQETRDQLQFLIGLVNAQQVDRDKVAYVEKLKKQ